MADKIYCFAVPGADHIIDVVNPDTFRTRVYGRTLEAVQATDPGAELVELDVFVAAKAARQDSAPRVWDEVTEQRYLDMLEALPPAAMKRGAFLVGEPDDHHAATGLPRFRCFKKEGSRHFRCSAPMTIREFREMFGPASYDYVE
jgi:hypothetical protein